jgi:signal transduction histidine kinase
MRLFQNIAIRHKLVAITMVTCVTALLLASVLQALYKQRDYMDETVKIVSAYAEMVGDNCRAALASEDAEVVTEMLRSLRVEPSIVFACAYDKHNDVLAQYKGPTAAAATETPRCRRGSFQFEGKSFKLFHQVTDEDVVLGTVFIQMDLSRERAEFLQGTLIIALVMVACLLLAYLMSSRLQKIVSGPILTLAHVAQAVSERKDYSRRAEKPGNDEVGLLIDAFNAMLEQIQQRDAALVAAKDNLEVKVAKRTAELKSANDQLWGEIERRTEYEGSLKRMNEKLTESNKQLQEFIYIASHDLREPTRKITAFGQLLGESLCDKLNADDKENLQFMIDGADRMQQMVEALLEYSRVATRGVAFERVDLNAIVEQLKSFELAMKIEETGGVISTKGTLPVVEGDATQVRQLMQNLISNAVKYHKKSVAPEVTIKANTQDDGMVRVEVHDNGIGIKKEQLGNVFVMFRRLNPRSEYEGMGIGLVVCKRIVERQGGRIGVESVYGEGSTFWFTLPAAPAAAEANELITSVSGSAT